MATTNVFAGNTTIFFEIYVFVPVPVIHRAGNRPESTVVFLVKL